MTCEYIIVQAGGRGSRMGILTKNKPKALVPIDNRPILFHLFKAYPEKKFIIIGDYKFDVLEKYLDAFATVDYQLINGNGSHGTCAGLREALKLIPAGNRFGLIWCDLLLSPDFDFSGFDEDNVVGISKEFPCRWKYENGHFAEMKSSEHGVAGLFIFKDSTEISDVPEEGEFVRWLSEQQIRFSEVPLFGAKEYGLLDEWEKIPRMRCRPFNKITFTEDRVFKEAVDQQGHVLAQRESAWYRKLEGDRLLDVLPEIYSYEPLVMEKINGKNVYEYGGLSKSEKQEILSAIVKSLRSIHSFGSIPYDEASYKEAYLDKTRRRLEKVRDLVPFANEPTVNVNGRTCRNIYYHWDELERIIMQYAPRSFVFLHGDCTFSNLLLRPDDRPVLIDPRGYFGETEFYGDPAYDWAKLFYSLFSNYDQFNLKRFELDIRDDGIELNIESNHWEDMEEYFFELLGDEVSPQQMRVLLAVIWLSLTTYAWEDYDSICGAFYNGLYYLEEAFENHDSAYVYFESNISLIEDSLRSIALSEMNKLLDECEATLKAGHKIVASGLGKNVPICEKFEGTMVSLGMNAQFLHTNSAVHGDMGAVKPGDLLIILTKSGNTAESIYLADLITKRDGVNVWLMSCNEGSRLANSIQNRLIIPLQHEGDQWNIVPNNSTTLFLIVLQSIAMQLSIRLGITLDMFKSNHPGGAIGDYLRG